eukprot:363538-Chlamydomonas_euryale.AAC.9
METCHTFLHTRPQTRPTHAPRLLFAAREPRLPLRCGAARTLIPWMVFQLQRHCGGVASQGVNLAWLWEAVEA